MTSNVSGPPEWLPIEWPAGPRIEAWAPVDRTADQWCAFKLAAAAFHLNTLRRLDDVLPNLDRYAGVELALDATLAALRGAFDAATAAVIEAAEESSQALPRTPAHEFTPRMCTDHLRAAGMTAVAEDIEAALRGQPSLGWLQVLSRIRNSAAHQRSPGRAHFGSATLVSRSVLTVSHAVTRSDGSLENHPGERSASPEPDQPAPAPAPTHLLLPGGGDAEPIAYLTDSLDRVAALTSRMLDAAVYVLGSASGSCLGPC